MEVNKMKIVLLLLRVILAIVLLAVISYLATFFLSIFMPDNVQKALEIFKTMLIAI
jgi:hypothetical protein